MKIKKQNRKEKLFTYVKKILPIIGIIILIYLIYNIGLNSIIKLFSKISVFHIMLIWIIIIPSILIKIFQWHLILKSQKIKICYSDLLKIEFIGDFYSSASPGRLGSFMKIPYLQEKTKEPFGKIITNYLIYNFLSFISFLTIFMISAIIFFEKIPILLPIGIVWISIYISIFLYFKAKKRGEKAIHLIIRVLVPKKLKTLFKKFSKTFYKDFPKERSLLITFLIGFIPLIIYYSVLYILAIALQINIEFHIFILLCPIITAISYIPISPGSIGIRELTVASVFSLFGIPIAESVVLSLAVYIIIGLPTVLIGFLFSIEFSKNKNKLKIRNFSFKKILDPEISKKLKS